MVSENSLPDALSQTRKASPMHNRDFALLHFTQVASIDNRLRRSSGRGSKRRKESMGRIESGLFREIFVFHSDT